MATRDIVQIDQQKCDGCGLCVPSCEEGAIQIVDGKAKVVSDLYCDGLGACLGHCPQDAISIVHREAEAFDEEAVARHLSKQPMSSQSQCGTVCPGTAAQQFGESVSTQPAELSGQRSEPQLSRLANWPVQLHLVPPHAPFLQQADLLLVADCVPFACANFHTHILGRDKSTSKKNTSALESPNSDSAKLGSENQTTTRPIAIGCPKLDDCHCYVAKLVAMIEQSQIQSISVVHMEVPCCTGLWQVAEAAIRQAGISIPLRSTVVTRRGEIIERQPSVPNTSPTHAPPRQLPIL